ncbi:unnamed protein product [Urochloa humidicola]
MRIFRSTPPSLQPGARWQGIRKALTRAGAATESVVAAAFRRRRLAGKHAHDGSGESVPCPRDGSEPTLPPNHPYTIRVRRIAANIISAACDDKTYAGPRQGLLQRIRRPFDGIHWRVEVFDSEYVDAYCSYDGHIRISTAFIGYTGKDADIATTLGHEVGHVIARHGLKTWRNMYWAGFLANFAAELLDVPREDDDDDPAWQPLFMRLSNFRQEFEADRLGLLLVAAAGYHPQIVPATYKSLGLLYKPSLPSVHDTHPECATRAQALSQAKVMDEALDLYREAVRSGKGVEGLDSWKSTLKYAHSWWIYWTHK